MVPLVCHDVSYSKENDAIHYNHLLLLLCLLFTKYLFCGSDTLPIFRCLCPCLYLAFCFVFRIRDHILFIGYEE